MFLKILDLSLLVGEGLSLWRVTSLIFLALNFNRAGDMNLFIGIILILTFIVIGKLFQSFIKYRDEFVARNIGIIRIKNIIPV